MNETEEGDKTSPLKQRMSPAANKIGQSEFIMVRKSPEAKKIEKRRKLEGITPINEDAEDEDTFVPTRTACRNLQHSGCRN